MTIPLPLGTGRFYMQVPMLVQGKSYTLKTPHGDLAFVFDDATIFCESIKTNQNAYSALSRVRYANFAIWLGDGGSRKIEGDLPTYRVFRAVTGECRIRNPWPSANITLFCNGKKMDEMKGSLLKFPTKKGKSYVLVSPL